MVEFIFCGMYNRDMYDMKPVSGVHFLILSWGILEILVRIAVLIMWLRGTDTRRNDISR